MAAEEAVAAVALIDSDGDGLLGLEDFVKIVEGAGEEERQSDLIVPIYAFANEWWLHSPSHSRVASLSQALSEIDVHPPDVVKTKGSGRRPLTSLEQAMKMKAKHGRKCAECGEVGNHDARNCKKIKEMQKKK
ncbi:hypothetical protein SASPL_114685 [Salvia splendens]|uniref:EF-hand domain-containing protein n=1 Tax=Salvia splendens TaxID=180675 RepID=A0A8X8Y2F6_SALSN|nr:hypothetical protein SASPL_114685 [Salvia splendens]